MENMKDIVREQFSLINIRPKVEKIMEDHNLHMEDIDVIGNSQSIYDGAPEEFFSMLEFYYVGIGEEAVMFEIRFKDGSRIYTEVDTDYNMVLVQYAMPPKDRGKAHFRNTLPPEMEEEIAEYINGKDPEYIKEVLRIFRIPAESLAKIPDEDQ